MTTLSTKQIVEKALKEEEITKKHFPDLETDSVINFIKGALWAKHKLTKK